MENNVSGLWNILFTQLDTKERKKAPSVCQESFHSLREFYLDTSQEGSGTEEKCHSAPPAWGQKSQTCVHKKPRVPKIPPTSDDLSSKTTEERKIKVAGVRNRRRKGPPRTQPESRC